MNAFGDIFERVNITSTANKVSGFAFSQYNTITFINHQILMSLDNFKEILDTIRKNVMEIPNQYRKDAFFKYETQIVKNSSYGIPKSKLFVRINEENTTDLHLAELKSGLRLFVKDDTVFLVDLRLVEKNTRENIKYLST